MNHNNIILSCVVAWNKMTGKLVVGVIGFTIGAVTTIIVLALSGEVSLGGIMTLLP